MKPRISKRETNRQRWRERINTWKDSDLSQKAFCEAHHLSVASFRRWLQIFKAEDRDAGVGAREPIRFLPVKLHEPASCNLTLCICNDLRVEIAPGFSPQLLRQVIQVLRAT